jgi:group I intron endonuclease
MGISGIYRIFNTDNGVTYIGGSVDIRVRWLTHLRNLRNGTHHSVKLQRAYNKYGVNCFEHEIIEVCDVGELILREQFYMDKHGSYTNGYNCTPIAGSTMLGRTHTDETKKKMSEASLGVKKTKEARKNMSIASKKRTEKGPIMIYSDERNKKISDALMGRKLSDEHRKKISENRKGVGFKSIVQYTKDGTFVKIWDSVTECSLVLGLDNSSVSKVLKGKLKTTGNYKFKYYE